MRFAGVAAAIAAILAFTLAVTVSAQDPAGSWLAYAVTKGNGRRVLSVSATTVVPAEPQHDFGQPAFWFGIEPRPALNLLQPIVPKWLSTGYYIFVEQFNWNGMNDWQSEQHAVSPGDKIWGSIDFIPENNTYTMACGSLTDGWRVSANRVVPSTQVFEDVYFVTEHQPSFCSQYPASNKIVYSNIRVKWSGSEQNVNWQPVKFQDACNCTAHVISASEISFTWQS